MVNQPPTLLFDIADDLRAISLDILREGGCDVPDRNYIEIGNVSAPIEFGEDCQSQLTVIAGPLTADLFTDLVQRRQGKAQCAMLWKSFFRITLFRCHPMTSGEETAPLPKPEQINNEAREHYMDMWQLARVLSWKWTHDELVPSYAFDCENTQWNNPAVTVRDPQGGMRAIDIQLSVSIHDHFEPEVMSGPFA